MLLYIVIFIATMIISMCYRKNKEYHHMTMTCLFITIGLTLIVNCVYFGVNYNSIPTVYETKIDSTFTVDSVNMYENNIICLYKDESKLYYNDLISDSILVEAGDKNNSYLVINKEKFKLSNKTRLWFCVYSYPIKSEKCTLKLNKKDYDLYEAYQNHVEKGEGTL